MVDERTALFNESCNIILNEATRVGSPTNEKEISDKIVTNLFRNIKKINNKTDMKIIEATKGDIQKLDNYGDLYNAEMFLSNLINKSTRERYLIETINILQNVRVNIINLKMDFIKGFQSNNSFVKTTYNTIVANYIICLGGLIANGISIYKDEFNIIRVSLKADINEKDILDIVEPLSLFNDSIKDGSFASTIRKYNRDKNELLNEDANTSMVDGLVSLVINTIKSLFYKSPIPGVYNKAKNSKLIQAGLGIIVVLLVLTRGAYCCYSTRILLSKYLEEIALLVEVSSQENTNPEIRAKQEKAAKIFKKLSEILSVDSKVANNKAKDISKKSVEDTVNETAKDINKDNGSSNTSMDDDEIF